MFYVIWLYDWAILHYFSRAPLTSDTLVHNTWVVFRYREIPCEYPDSSLYMIAIVNVAWLSSHINWVFLRLDTKWSVIEGQRDPWKWGCYIWSHWIAIEQVITYQWMPSYMRKDVCWATNVSRQYRLRTQITLRALLVEPLKFLRHYLFRTHYG